MCKFPLKGFKIGLTDKGKPDYLITSYKVNFVWSSDGTIWHKSESPLSHFPGHKVISDFIEVPCGKCIECRLAYSRQWADRCYLESLYHTSNYFLTLTYNEESLVYSQKYCETTGELLTTPSLELTHLQKFFKRMRKAGYKFRYYSCGEYGTNTMRPHYHCVMFGLEIDDLELYKTSDLGFSYFTSKKIERIWGNGFVVIAPFCWETAAYTARYCMKKSNNNLSAFYDLTDASPEFVVMSRKPGIGREYFDDNLLKIYATDEIYISSSKGGQKHKPPRYFDNLYERELPEVFTKVKDLRKDVSEEFKRMKLESTSLDYMSMLSVENDNLESRLKKLVRDKL